MREPTPRLSLVDAPVVHALAERYAARHRSMENYVLAWWTTARLAGRLGAAPGSARAAAVNLAFVVGLLLGVPLAITAATGQWAAAPVRTWALVAVAFGALGLAIQGPFRAALEDFLCLHRSMVDAGGMRRLIAYDERWFTVRRAAPAGALFAVGTLAALRVLARRTAAPTPAWGTAVLGAMLLYQVGEIMYAVVMLGLESRILGGYDYALYRLSPIDSVALQRSIRGSNQIALLVSVVGTGFILGFAVLLTSHSKLVGPLCLGLLATVYVATAFGVLLPRLAMRRVITEEKHREMAPLQTRLDALAARGPAITEDEHKELVRLRGMHDMIRDSRENVLPVRSVGQLASSLILPTLTFAATFAGRTYVQGLIQRVLR